MMRRASEAVVQAAGFQGYVRISHRLCPMVYARLALLSWMLYSFDSLPRNGCFLVLVGAFRTPKPHNSRIR